MPDSEADQRFHGSCHCGNIRFWFDWPGQTATIPIRACGCSFCQKHGAVWTSNPNGQFQLTIDDPAQAVAYQFGTKTADFHLCTACGVPPIVTCTMAGRRYAVLNVNTFNDVDAAIFDRSPTDFDGETVDSRLDRRQRNWTPEAHSE